MTVEFLVTSLIVVLLPGTGVIYTVSTGLSRGAVASIYAAIGCTVGIVPHLCASIFGVAAFLHASAVAFQVFKLIGVCYLVYLAWMMWKDSGEIAIADKQAGGHHRIAIQGALINVLNPKLSIFFLAFLPQFIPAGSEGALSHVLMLSGVFMLLTLVVFIGYGLFANQVRQFIVNSPALLRRIQKMFAGAFVLLAARLAAAER